MSYQTIWETKGVLWQYTGIVTTHDVVNSNNEFYGDPRSEDIFYQLVDGSQIEKLELDESALELLAATDYAAALTIRQLKIAFVATRPEIIAFFQTYIDHANEFNSNWQYKTFNNIDSARRWIAIKNTY